MLFKGLSKRGGVRLIGIFNEQVGQKPFVGRQEQRGGGLPFVRVKSEIERPIRLEAEAAQRIINLHRRHTEIREDKIKALLP